MKLNKKEINWILYDVGNSAYTLLVTAILPIYFAYIAKTDFISETNYLAYWGYAQSIVTIIVAFLAPIFGSAADSKNAKKRIFTYFFVIGVVFTVLMSIKMNTFLFLIIFVISKVGYQASLVFYDSMLTDITTKERMDSVSSHGYAWGYIGSCIPFIISLLIILKKDLLGIETIAINISFYIIAIWWVIFTIPLLKTYKQKFFISETRAGVKDIVNRLSNTLKEIRKNKILWMFLLSFFFYIDGVYTIISMATAYGTSLGLSQNGLLIALLVTQIVAFPCAIIFSMLSRIMKTHTLIRICIIAYAIIVSYAIKLSTTFDFWVLAIAVGMFQGAIQALSRSYYAKLIPAEASGEYFGIYDICGKGASFLGTFLVAIFTQFTGKQNLGVAVLLIMFILGIIFFERSVYLSKKGA